MNRAACKGANPRLFDAELDGIDETPYARGVRHGQAINMCARCPVVQQCLTEHLAAGLDGIAGGYLLETEPEDNP